MSDAPRAFRAPLRSRRPDVPEGVGVERGLTLGLCGFGGALEPAPATFDEAVATALRGGDQRLAWRIQRFAKAPDGAYVWTRDIDELYWVGRLSGPYRYDADPAAALVDLVHVRTVTWREAPVDPALVPAAVLATFGRGGRNWQEIHHPSVGPESERAWT